MQDATLRFEFGRAIGVYKAGNAREVKAFTLISRVLFHIVENIARR
jgi:hypothetical protein